MKKIMVLVDFSAPSINAIAYAADLANDKGFTEIVLASNCHVPLFEQIVPTPDYIQVGDAEIKRRTEKMMQQLLELKTEIDKKLHPGISTKIIIGTMPLLRSVLDQVAREEPSLVVIGSTRHALEDCSTGRQIIPLAKLMPVPVLVIPPECRYRNIEEALVAGSGPVESTPDTKEALQDLFGSVQYHRYTLEKKDILQGVLRAAEEAKVEMIVALPGKHSIFYNLTHQNIMHAIVLNATEPVLILK